MPELGEQMYCSQQICIPPTFPYLLRQFAKSAIRTQPNDLLKWSTAYFRCLSLNIPPPVKPRLEYPIPRDYQNITPGWLRALNYQLKPSDTYTFKTLWDRWIGACLLHPTLIQILCLGAFSDNQAVPWLRFVALCAGHLTDNLTQTMILICEVLTEEPEGGSAMIPVAIFNDLYRFLARLEAGIPQTLRNYWFLDKFLELYEEKIAKDAGPKAAPKAVEEKPMSIVSSEESEESVHRRKHDDRSLVSCPSVPSEDPDNFYRLMDKMEEDNDQEEEFLGAEEGSSSNESEILSEPTIGSEKAVEPMEEPPVEEPREEPPQGLDDERESLEMGSQGEDEEPEAAIPEDTEKYLKSLELGPGEFDAVGTADVPMEAIDVGMGEVQVGLEIEGEMLLLGGEDEEEGGILMEELLEIGPPYEEVFCEAIPGIGQIVPEEMVNAVVAYMESMAAIQHGMVMPRNIRHFLCPPLHVYSDDD